MWVNYPCIFHDILLIVDSSSLLFENDSDERRSESLFVSNKHGFVEKLFINLRMIEKF